MAALANSAAEISLGRVEREWGRTWGDRSSDFCKYPSEHPAAYITMGGGEEPIPAEAKWKEFSFFLQIIWGVLWSLAFAFCLFLHWRLVSFFIWGRDPSSGWAVNASQQAVCCFGFEKRTSSFFCCALCFTPAWCLRCSNSTSILNISYYFIAVSWLINCTVGLVNDLC